MSNDVKPVDLAEVDRCADVLEKYDFDHCAEMMRNMRNEIERWRELASALIEGASGAHDGDRDKSRTSARSVVDRMRSMLPPR
jgi:hypothetical protein